MVTVTRAPSGGGPELRISPIVRAEQAGGNGALNTARRRV
jgi:hypothetical protein